MVNGKGGLAGPDLSNEANKGRSREWLATKIRNPKADNPQTIMPAYATLSDEQVNDLVDYLLSLTTTGGQAGATAARTTERPADSIAVSASSVTAGGKMWSRQVRTMSQSPAAIRVQRRPMGGCRSPHASARPADG